MNAVRTVPFSPPYMPEAAIEAVAQVLRSGWITTGPKVAEFEKNLAAYCSVPAVVALNSATAGLELVLRWYGVGPGDEVLVPAYTYAATANVVKHCGATAVMVDVNYTDCNVTLANLQKCITPRTKVVMTVDIAGWPVEYAAVMQWLNGADVRQGFRPGNAQQEALGRPLYLSDAAHSVGAKIDGMALGRQADFSVFSFHAVKNLCTAEGGAVCVGPTVADVFGAQTIYTYLRSRSLHGQTKDAMAKLQPGAWQYDIVEAGYKCNLTDIAAAIGVVQLERYERESLPRRKALVERYRENLKDLCELLPVKDAGRETAYHLQIVRIPGFDEAKRNSLIIAMAERGVATNVHFQPLPLLSAYKHAYKMVDYPEAYRAFASAISLPLYEHMERDAVDYVCDTLNICVKNSRAL